MKGGMAAVWDGGIVGRLVSNRGIVGGPVLDGGPAAGKPVPEVAVPVVAAAPAVPAAMTKLLTRKTSFDLVHAQNPPPETSGLATSGVSSVTGP